MLKIQLTFNGLKCHLNCMKDAPFFKIFVSYIYTHFVNQCKKIKALE